MGDSFFKVILHDESWDVRTEAKRYGMLFQLYVDRKKPKEIYIKYKNTRDAGNARASLAKNENVVRVEAMEKWDIPAKKKTDNKPPDTNGSGSALPARNAQHRGPANNSASGIGGMGGLGGGRVEPIPLMLGMFNACTSCRKGGASFQCFVCGAFYCGEPCQRADWPGHIIHCLPRLVRIHTGFVPNETQTMAFPPPSILQMQMPGNLNHPLPKDDRKQQVSNKKNESQQNGAHKEFAANMPIKSPLKSTERNKLTPPSNVPTNVLKNLALKRHQEQEASTSYPAESHKPETSSAAKNEATTGKENACKLSKRVQQKASVLQKGTIQYSAFSLEGEYVKISYVSDNALFVYRSGQEANGAPNRYIDLIKRSVECARGVKQLLSTAPKPCDMVFAPFDGDHYRALVKSVDGAMATVFYPDFGNTQTVEWNRMKEIPDREIQNGLCYTHAVKIEGVSEFSPLVKQYLEELLEMDDFELVKISSEKSDKTVELRHVQDLYLLSEKVQELAKKANDKESGGTSSSSAEAAGAASVEKTIAEKPPTLDPPSSYVPVTVEDFIEHDLPQEEDVQLMVVEASELHVSNQLSVILNSDSLAFALMMNECHQHGEKDPHPYQPTSENEVFLVHFEGVWCRALLAGLGEEVQYYLLDLGIIRALDDKPNCRRFPAGLTRKIFVCECIVDNLDALGEYSKEENNDALRGKTLNARVYQQTDDEGETMHLKVHSIN